MHINVTYPQRLVLVRWTCILHGLESEMTRVILLNRAVGYSMLEHSRALIVAPAKLASATPQPPTWRVRSRCAPASHSAATHSTFRCDRSRRPS